jgi:hypothetical protein
MSEELAGQLERDCADVDRITTVIVPVIADEETDAAADAVWRLCESSQILREASMR